MKVKVFQVNAFVGGENGGNPAGVVLDADQLTTEQMQKIAYDLGYSETAFVLPSTKADYRVRFFTVTTEVPLCGHATLATRYLLQNKGVFTKPEGCQETLAGLLSIKVDGDMVTMEQALPVFTSVTDEEMVLASLGITRDDLLSQLPIELVSTGFPTILVPVKDLEKMKSIKVNLDQGKIVSNKTNLIHVFTLESFNSDSIAFSRNFFPDITEDEDVATGTATGALACYLFQHGLLAGKDLNHLVFDQGYLMEKPSRLMIKLETNNQAIEKVWVGGKCEVIKEFTIQI